MSIERVRAALKEWGLDGRIREFGVSSATVELAANALGVAPARIAKSLTFLVDEKAVMVVAAGDARVDNTRFKAQFHTKARMLTAEQVSTLIGHEVGGVCPFGINEGVEVFLDISLKRFETVYPACGSANSAIELTPEQLREICAAPWIDVCKAWREE